MTVQPTAEQAGLPAHDRRAAVRRIATAVGLGAGALALPALSGTADAAAGEVFRTGSKNDAGDAQTTLKSSSSSPSLRVENTRSKPGSADDTVDLISPQLQLAAPVASASRPQMPDAHNPAVGSLALAGGVMLLGADLGVGAPVPVQVHTSAVSNLLVPVPPASATVFDTATMTADQRAALPAGAFDINGRVAPGVRLPISMRGLINTERFTQVALASVSLTAAGADFSGAICTHADAVLPGEVVVLSYAVLPKEVTAHGQPVALATTATAFIPLDRLDQLWISATTATHLKVQVTAFAVPDPSVLVEPETPSPALDGAARRSALQRQALREMTASLPAMK